MKLRYLIILIFVSLILIIFGILSVDNSKNVTDEDEKTPVSEESEDYASSGNQARQNPRGFQSG